MKLVAFHDLVHEQKVEGDVEANEDNGQEVVNMRILELI